MRNMVRSLTALVLLAVALVGCASSVDTRTQPRANIDHWRSIFGLYDCTQEPGQEYRDFFESTRDDYGIHSHADGVISIHPFVPHAAGASAQMGLFYESMQVQVEPERIVLDDGSEIVLAEGCANGDDPVLRTLRWNTVEAALAGDEPEIIVGNPNTVVLEADGQVIVLALAAPDTEIAPPAHTGTAWVNDPNT